MSSSSWDLEGRCALRELKTAAPAGDCLLGVAKCDSRWPVPATCCMLSQGSACHAGQATSISEKPLAEHAPPKARFSKSMVGHDAGGKNKGSWRSQVCED